MSRHRKTLKTLGWLGVVVAAFGLLAACGDDDDDTGSPTPGTATPTATPAGTLTPGPGAAIPPEVRNNDGDWPLPNADYRNTRYATNSTINSSNIDQLGLAWTVPVTGSGRFGAIATNPVVAGGTVYYQDLSSNVYAVDAESGELVWKNEIGRESIGPNGVAPPTAASTTSAAWTPSWPPMPRPATSSGPSRCPSPTSKASISSSSPTTG